MEERAELAVGGRGEGADLARRIALWLKEQLGEARARGFVVGLSGGVDSAVVAALALRAAPAEATLGLILPCESNPADAADAALVAQALGLRTVTVDLAPALSALQQLLPPGNPVAIGNLKARLRMIVLYHHALLRSALVLGTGNRTEIELGYFTKYGDGGCDLLPLGALVKREVRALAAHLGVPRKIIAKPPTAGLWPNQTDEGELGASYEELDQAVELLGTSRERASPERARRVLAARHAPTAHKRRTPRVFPRTQRTHEG